MHKNKVNLKKVLASLNTLCPLCGCSISPAEVLRIDFDRMRCPNCGEIFSTNADPTRKTD
jgi:ribosomal protein S27AE